MERKIPIFGSKQEDANGKNQKKTSRHFQPDFEIMDKESDESSCIIEVKKLVIMPWSGKFKQSKSRDP